MTKKFTLRQMLCCLLLLATTGAIAQNLTDEAAIKAKVLKNISQTGISPSYLKDAHISSAYKDAKTGIEHIYLQQNYQGIDVYNQIVSLAFKDDKLLYASGKFINAIERKTGTPTPSLSAQDAVLKAAAHLNLTALLKNLQVKGSSFLTDKKISFSPAGISKKDIITQLYWTADSLNKLHLTWNVNIDVINKPDWWNVRVDALSGGIVQKDNWTTYEGGEEHAGAGKPANASSAAGKAIGKMAAPPTSVTSASYNVIPFPADNLNITPFTMVVNPWDSAGTNNNATTYGWQYDGATDYTISRGNNVYAYEDRDNNNQAGVSASSSTSLPDLTFGAQPDFNKQPYDSVNQQVAITNLFYWNNLMHDVMYQYGFDEISGNFQANNLLRGGQANDYVLAEAQDGGGSNNANFATPVDGSSGRMQMYLWSAAFDTSKFIVNTPGSIAGSYNNVESVFSTNNKLVNVGPVTGKVVYYSRTDTLGCFALPTGDTSLKGKIALIYRGSCAFTVKVKNAENAGAIGAVVVTYAGQAPIPMGGTDNTIVTPAEMISNTDGNIIAASIRAGDSVSATMRNNSIFLDGDLDNGIICHEYGHGVSNRLTGGPANSSCLYNAEQGGEGWSDYQALMMTTNWATETLTDGTRARGVGTYAIGESANGTGLRRQPYSTDLSIDSVTYASVALNPEVHNIGEIWCSALWDMTWNIIQQEGFIEPNLYNSSSNGGNAIALQLVLEGMKLQPCGPGFLDARNAILAADSILYGYRHKCAIWNAFARRGMGFSAQQGLSTSATDQVPAYDALGVTLTRNINTVFATGQLTQNLTATCGCSIPATNHTLTDTIPSGFTYVSSTGGSYRNNVVSFPLSFSAPLEVQNLSVTLNAPTGCNIDTVVYDDRDAHTTGGFVSSTQYGTGKWDSTAAKSYSPTHSWYAPDEDNISQYTLTSGTFTPKGFSQLSFWHFLNTEYLYDGGLVELQVNGSSWRSAAPYFVKNGYNSTIYATVDSSTGANFAAGAAFSGEPFPTFSQTLIDLSSFSDSTVSVRYRLHSDQNTFVDGWYVDDITVANGCGGYLAIGLYNGTTRLDSFRVPVYAVPSVLPVTLTAFTAEAQSASALLKWTTTSEVNMKNYVVEASKDGNTYAILGQVAAIGLSQNSYTLTDAKPYNGWNYYRIKMVNNDGSFTYSPVRSVLFTSKGLIAVRPNPATSSTTVYIDKDITVSYLTITDLQGKILKQVNGKNIGSTYTLNTGSMANGTYLVKITPVNGAVVTVKLVVQH